MNIIMERDIYTCIINPHVWCQIDIVWGLSIPFPEPYHTNGCNIFCCPRVIYTYYACIFMLMFHIILMFTVNSHMFAVNNNMPELSLLYKYFTHHVPDPIEQILNHQIVEKHAPFSPKSCQVSCQAIKWLGSRSFSISSFLKELRWLR